MLETLFVSLTLAAVSGLAFIAYKHPAGYRKIGSTIIFLVMLGAGGILGTQIGMIMGEIGILEDSISRRPDDEASSLAEPISRLADRVDRIQLVFMVSAAVVGYLIFLKALPQILGLPMNGDSDKEGSSESGK